MKLFFEIEILMLGLWNGESLFVKIGNNVVWNQSINFTEMEAGFDKTDSKCKRSDHADDETAHVIKAEFSYNIKQSV